MNILSSIHLTHLQQHLLVSTMHLVFVSCIIALLTISGGRLCVIVWMFRFSKIYTQGNAIRSESFYGNQLATRADVSVYKIYSVFALMS